MEEQALKELAGNVGVALVIFLFAFGFWLYDKRKRQKERNRTSIDDLKPGKVFLIRKLDIDYSSDLEKPLVEWAKHKGGRVIKGKNGSQMVYLNERGKSQFNGFLNIPSELLPVRIVLFENEGVPSLRLDEDWGFQMFVGLAKKSFSSRYQNQLNYWANEIEELFK